MRTWLRGLAELGALLAVLLAAPYGHTAPSGVDPDESRRAEAQRRFRNGVELYQDGDARGAVVEFKRAYDLAPNFRVLYNLGQVSYEVGDWATARRAFESYLREGGAQVPEPRRAEVEQTLALLAGRTGSVEIVAMGAGDILVDDVPVGTSPLRDPILVNVGTHAVTYAPRAGSPQNRRVEVGGGERARVVFAPPAASPAARISSRPVTLSERTQPAQPSDSASVWVAWSATALAAAGGATAAVFAARAADDLEQERNVFPASPTRLDDAEKRTRELSLVADGLFVGAGLLGVIAIYLSLRGRGGTPNLAVSREGLLLGGRF